MLLYTPRPVCFRIFRSCETFVGLTLGCQRPGFRAFPSPPASTTTAKTHTTLIRICRVPISYPIYVVLLRHCSRYPAFPFPSIPNRSYPFALLNFLVIFALNTPRRRAEPLYPYS